MEVKDALHIMISFAALIIALLTYIANNYKRK
ncbi:putative holin-like toxin [Paenibacillus cremeus]|nr:putative holin-like toxin [Paenibacillus cremeus]